MVAGVQFGPRGLKVNSGNEISVIESVKAASDIYSPIDGEVVEVNNNLTDDASIINKDAEKDGWILDNVDKISSIPTVIVQGRYDVVCPIKSAWDLHKNLSNSKLFIIQEAGHSMLEKGIQKKLIELTDKFSKK